MSRTSKRLSKLHALTSSVLIGDAANIASDKHLLQSPENKELMMTAPRFTEQEQLAITPTAYLLWIGKGSETEEDRVVLVQNAVPISYATQEAAEEFLASAEGQHFIGSVFTQGYVEVGIRAINGGGYALWDMQLYTAAPAEGTEPDYFLLSVNDGEGTVYLEHDTGDHRRFPDRESALVFASEYLAEPGITDHVWKITLVARQTAEPNDDDLYEEHVYWPDAGKDFRDA